MVAWLVSRNVPMERAERMDHLEAKAWMIMLGEIGRPGEKRMEWDWLNDRWAINP
jgi:hypothetical protein